MEKLKMTMFRHGSNIKAFFGIFAIVGMVLCQGCGNMVEPPVSVTFRESLLTGAVMQLHNRSDKRVVCEVYVENNSKNQSTTCRLGVAPNDMTEVGILEMGWAFEEGEGGYVEVDGYRGKIYFELKDGAYHTHIGF